jgi:hypothetical protein
MNRSLRWIFILVVIGFVASSCATNLGAGIGGEQSGEFSESMGLGESGSLPESIEGENPGASTETVIDSPNHRDLIPGTPVPYLELLNSISPLSQVVYQPWDKDENESNTDLLNSEQVLNPSGLARLLVLRRVFPQKIQWIFPGTDDWLISMEGTRFRWAEGRMLYAHQPFGGTERDQYMPIWDLRGLDLPIWHRKITSGLEAELLDLNERYGFDPRIRNQGFLDLLYDAPDQQQSQLLMVRTRFLGLSLEIHPMVIPSLQRVEQRIFQIAATNPEVQAYIESLAQAWGFFWRPIAGTNRRSMHSYGIAIDLLPQYYGRRFPYWRWALESGFPQWWLLPPRQFYYPHPLVIEAFEQEGFLWGGRWTGFDTIHFEYRPEYMAFEEPLTPLLPKEVGR